jgi:tryptophan synthase alpha chain
MALIPFLTIGDPDLETSVALVQAAEAAGAHMIELGVPYSDPLADGPVIQRASERALRNRVTLTDCIEVAAEARSRGVAMPFIMFTYFNPVLQLGLERFFRMLKENGVSGAIIPDLPMEEDEEPRRLAEQAGIHLIPLVAPTSESRVERIVSRASGFVYCVSSLGVTGVRTTFHEGVESFLASVRQASRVPICLGFGISSREQVERFSGICDGVAVGSAIVRTVEEALPLLTSADASKKEAGIAAVRDFIASLKPRSSP